MISGIEHVAIVARDSAVLKEWYAAMFNFGTVYDNGKGTFFLKAPDGSMIEMLKGEEEGPVSDPKIRGIRHLALTVDDLGFDTMVAKLKKANVETLSDVSVAPNGIKTYFFRDPEGNILHLIYRPQPLS